MHILDIKKMTKTFEAFLRAVFPEYERTTAPRHEKTKNVAEDEPMKLRSENLLKMPLIKSLKRDSTAMNDKQMFLMIKPCLFANVEIDFKAVSLITSPLEYVYERC